MNRQAVLLLIAVGAFLLMLLIGNPYSTAWFLKCPLHFFTGYQCPLCGMQRQLHALMVLDFREAWHLNPGLLVCYPYLAVLFFSQLFPKLRMSKLGMACNSNEAIFAFMAVMLMWGIARNLI